MRIAAGTAAPRAIVLALSYAVALALPSCVSSREDADAAGTAMTRGTAMIRETLVTPDPLPQAKALYAYLLSMRGKGILSGQQATMNAYELKAVAAVTGSYPAVGGFDLIDYSPSRVERGAMSRDTGMALAHAKAGGIVSMCWHWNAPALLYDKAPDRLWWSGFYTKATLFRADEAMEEKAGKDYDLIVRDIDAIAVQLEKLEDAGVPVLWRPLHEASGGWFWWGASGSETYIELYRFMFDRLVNHHGLRNLIWVWNGQDADWYPGDDVVDIASEDVYADARDYSSQKAKWLNARGYPGAPKLIALSENGVVPDPALLVKDSAAWSWFCTWSGKFAIDEGTKRYSGENTEAEALKRFYAHPYVITRDELPDFGYRAEK